MQMDPTAALTSTLLSQAQPTVQLASHINMSSTQATRESERPLQHEANRPFTNPVYLSSVLDTRIPFPKLFQKMLNLRHVPGGLVLVNRESDEC